MISESKPQYVPSLTSLPGGAGRPGRGQRPNQLALYFSAHPDEAPQNAILATTGNDRRARGPALVYPGAMPCRCKAPIICASGVGSASWYKVTMTGEEIHAGEGFKLQDEFTALFLAHRMPDAAVMFCSRAGVDNDFYFTPEAVAIARELIAHYAGAECPTPAGSSLALLVGNARWERFLVSPKH